MDWKPEQRGDLEIAMRKGVVALAYDCQSVRMLPNCRIDGEYGFTESPARNNSFVFVDTD